MRRGILGALVVISVVGAAAASLWCCDTRAPSVASPREDASPDQRVTQADSPDSDDVDDAAENDDRNVDRPDVCGEILEAGPGCLVPDAAASCDGGLCEVTAGCFIMGSPPCQFGRGAYSENQIQVTLTHSFFIEEHEVTQAEVTAAGFPNPSGLDTAGRGDCSDPQCPVGNVTWYDALAFANRRSEQEGLAKCYDLVDCSGTIGDGLICRDVKVTAPSIYQCPGDRLPTEAEWEYAERAGTTTAFYSGDIQRYASPYACNEDPSLSLIGWYCYNANSLTHPVAQKQANGWGLFDMAGNSMEWISDQFKGSGYGEGPVVDPGGILTGLIYPDGGYAEERSLRGGLITGPANMCTSSYRFELRPSTRSPGVGFRLARTKL